MQARLLANPAGGNVTGGTANISTGPGQVTVNQSSQRAIVNWRSFSIDHGETTTFVQPNNSSATLNRVTGGGISKLDGKLNANGKVFLVNPNGVVIGKTGRINTGSFTASTHDVADMEFMKGGDLNFSGKSGAKIVNNGRIKATDGDITLIARQIENNGNISARTGRVHLAAGTEVLLKSDGSERVYIKPGSEGAPGGTGIVNTGNINSTVAELKAAGGNEYALAINNSGTIRATGWKKDGGRVYLTSAGGKIVNSGRVRAVRADGSGGEIRIAASRIELKKGAVLDASGAAGQNGKGGTVLVGGEWQGSGAMEQAKSVTVEAGAEIHADATPATGTSPLDGGTVVLWSTGDTLFEGLITARGTSGGRGGQVETSGKNLGIGSFGSVNTGGGNWLLDPTDLDVIAGGGGSITGGVNDPGPTTIDPNVVEGALATGNVTLMATNSITVSSVINSPSIFNLTLMAGAVINLNAGITLSAASLDLQAPTLNLNVPLNIAGTITGTATTVYVGAAAKIQQGIFAASTASTATVNLAAATYSEANIVVDRAVTIQGQGSSSSLISVGLGRGFDITSSGSGTVTLDGVGIGNALLEVNTATPATGAGVRIASGANVVISNSRLVNNVAQNTVTTAGVPSNAYAAGGGIYNAGNLTLNNVTLGGNAAIAVTTSTDAFAPAIAEGGGVYSSGTISIQNCTFNGNAATAEGSVTETTTSLFFSPPQARGGGLYVTGSGMLMDGTTFTSNSANTVGSRINATLVLTAGSTNLDTYGGAVFVSGTDHEISNSQFTGNVAGNGGGIFLNASSGLELRTVTVSGNRSSGGSVSDQPTVHLEVYGGSGGGIGAGSGTNLRISGSTITNNGIFIFRNQVTNFTTGVFTHSMSSSPVGGGLASSGVLEISNSILSNNFIRVEMEHSGDISAAGSVSAGISTFAQGGGIYFTGSMMNLDNVTLTGNTITTTVALTGQISSSGSVITIASSASSGGGIYQASGGGVTLNSVRLVGNGIVNTATNTSVISSSFTITQQANILANGGGYNLNGGPLDVSGSEISSNGLAFTTVSSGTSSNTVLGGGFFLSGVFAVTMRNTTIAGNSSRSGGGVYVTGPSLTLDSVTIANNTASAQGGGIYSSNIVTIGNSILANNAAGTGPDVFLTAAPNETAPNLISIVDGSPLASDGVFYGTAASPIDARLGTLDFYGGTTRTIPLLAGSPALDAGSTLLTQDQRGASFVRPAGSTADIGAYERQPLLSLVITPDILSKVYGTANPADYTFTNTGATLYSGDTLASILTGALTRVTGESVGAYDVLIGSLALTSQASTLYSLTFDSSVDFTITKRSLSVVVDAKTKTYGNADPTLTAVISGPDGGLVAGDSITLTRATGETVAGGPYAISIDTFVGATNYDLNFVGANLSITRRVITVTADPKSKTYGDLDLSLTFSVTGPDGGLVAGDSITLIRAAGETVAGGPYTISINTFAGAANYDMTYAGASLNILRRTIELTPTGLSKNYGDADPGTYTITNGSLAPGNSLRGLFSHTGGETVGSYPITQGTASIINGLGADVLANYDLTIVPGMLSINPRPITVGVLPGGKVYGNTDPTLIFSVTGGLAFGESLSSVVTGSLFRAPGENVGSYLISVSGFGAINPNYSVIFDSAPRFFTVAPCPVTVSVLAGQGKVYGEMDPTLLFAITSGNIIPGDAVTGNLVRVGGENVGAYEIGSGTVTAGSNYVLTFLPSDFVITRRPLTILPDSGQTLNQGGSSPGFTFTFTGGLAPGDTLQSVFGGNLGFLGDDPGEKPFTLGTLGLLSSPNYVYTLSPDSPFLTVLSPTVTRRAITGLDIFNSTHGRNNEDENHYVHMLPFPLHAGQCIYAPAGTPSPGLMHVSSHDVFGQDR